MDEGGLGDEEVGDGAADVSSSAPVPSSSESIIKTPTEDFHFIETSKEVGLDQWKFVREGLATRSFEERLRERMELDGCLFA